MSKPLPTIDPDGPAAESGDALKPLTLEQVQRMIFRAAFGDVLTFPDEQNDLDAGASEAAVDVGSEPG